MDKDNRAPTCWYLNLKYIYWKTSFHLNESAKGLKKCIYDDLHDGEHLRNVEMLHNKSANYLRNDLFRECNNEVSRLIVSVLV